MSDKKPWLPPAMRPSEGEEAAEALEDQASGVANTPATATTRDEWATAETIGEGTLEPVAARDSKIAVRSADDRSPMRADTTPTPAVSPAKMNRPSWLVSDTMPPSTELEASLILALSGSPTRETMLPGSLPPELLRQALGDTIPPPSEPETWDPLASPTLEQRTWRAPGPTGGAFITGIAEQEDVQGLAEPIRAPTAISSSFAAAPVQPTAPQPVAAEAPAAAQPAAVAMPWDVDAGLAPTPAEVAAASKAEPVPAIETPVVAQPAPRPEAAPVSNATKAALLAQAVATLAVCAAVSVFFLRPGPTVAAGAAEWLDAIGTDAAPSGPGSQFWRWLATKTGRDTVALMGAVQTVLGTLSLSLAAELARRLAGWPAAIAAVALLALWPAGQAAVFAVGPESWLALSALGSAVAALWWTDRPVAAVAVATLAWTLGLAAHPIGWLAVPLFVVSTALLPAQEAPELLPGVAERPDVPTRAVVLPWLAAICLTLGLLSLLTGPDGFKLAGKAAWAVLRAPAPEPELGWLAEKPVIGPVVVLLGQLPFVLVVLAFPVFRLAVTGGRAFPGAALGGVVAAWLAALIALDLPLPGSGLSGLLPIVPLFAVAAASAAYLWVKLAYGMGGIKGITKVVLLTSAALGCLVLDLQLEARDARTLLGHIPGVLRAAEPVQPARLTPSDRALLAKFPQPAAILPASRGGGRLAEALKRHVPALQGVGYGAPFAGDLVLLPEPPHHPVDQHFARVGERLGCSSDLRTCLYQLRQPPESAKAELPSKPNPAKPAAPAPAAQAAPAAKPEAAPQKKPAAKPVKPARK